MSKEKKTNTTWVAPSVRATKILNIALEEELSDVLADEQSLEEAHRLVSEEKQAEQILKANSDRDALRVLFLTRDASVLTEGSLMQRKFLGFCSVFDEVHIVVLSEKKESRDSVTRVGKRMWIYPTHSRYWWKTVFDAEHVIRKQLVFGSGFRPDMIVALDPYESGVAGLWTAYRYERAFQVHVSQDFYHPSFLEEDEHNGWRRKMAKYVIKRADSVRAHTDRLTRLLQTAFKRKKQVIETLPVYLNLKHIKAAAPHFSLQKRYPQFSFIMLTASELEKDDHTRVIVDAAMRVLVQHNHAGLVVVGDGPRRKFLEERATALGISNQVRFEAETTDIISHLKTAHLYLNASTSREAEHRVLEAAAASVPFVTVATDTITALFAGTTVDFICPVGDVDCFAEKITDFLQYSHVRTQYTDIATTVIEDRLEEDFALYAMAYRNHVESTLLEEV